MKKYQKIGVSLCLFSIISNTVIPLSAVALDYGFYSSNSILFFNPDACSDDAGNSIAGGNDELNGYTLPASSGKTGGEDPISESGVVVGGKSGEHVTFSKHAALGQEYRDYYITMRWNWTSWNWNGTNKGVDNKQYDWMAKEPRIILVTNPRTGKSVNAVALESGPAPWTGVDRSSNNSPKQGWKNPQKGTPDKYTGRVSGLPPKAIKAIDAKMGMYDGSGDKLTYQWASDQKSKPGPTDAAAAPLTMTTNKNAIKLEKSDTLQQIYNGLTTGGMDAVQASAVMGNMYAESSFKSDAVEAGNGQGYGLAQWSKGRRTQLFAFADSKKVSHSDIAMQIEFLLQEYNQTYKTILAGNKYSGFREGKDINKATTDWMMVFEAPGMKPKNDPAALNSKRIPAAAKVYELYSQSNDINAEENCGESSTGNGVVAGDIVKTALNFALDKPATQGMTSESDAKPAFIEAVKKDNPPLAGKIADCGAFVGTVMKASEADKDYPGMSTSAQKEYVEGNPKKYKIIKNPKRTDLQPGDILIRRSGGTGHTQIYTGESPYPVVDASLNDRVPSVRSDGSLAYMLGQSSLIAARLIKS